MQLLMLAYIFRTPISLSMFSLLTEVAVFSYSLRLGQFQHITGFWNSEWNNYSFLHDSKHNLLTLSDSVIISNCFSLITVIYLIYDYSLLWTKFDTVFCRKASTGRSGSRNSGHSSQPCSVGDQWSYCTQAQVWLWHSNRGVSLETSGRSLSNPRAV